MHSTIDAYRACAETAIALIPHHKVLLRSPAEMAAQASMACSQLEKVASLFPIARPRRELMAGFLRLVQHGDKTGARARWLTSLHYAQKMHMPYDLARAHLALAAVTSGAQRGEHQLQAAQLLAGMGMQKEHAQLAGVSA
jgi:hypothetical protein